MANAQLNMKTGYMYMVVFRSGTQRKDHYLVMRFLGYGTGVDKDAYLFNARPVAGTQSVPKEWVKSIVAVAPNSKIVIDKVMPLVLGTESTHP